jgi:hypothetical protein
LSFSGLKPASTYNVVFHAHRDSYAWDRASLVTISGADSFVNASSVATDDHSNPLYSGLADDSTRLPADNDAGYVAFFSSVSPGGDAQFELTISWDGSDPSSAFKGKYGSVVMLEELP